MFSYQQNLSLNLIDAGKKEVLKNEGSRFKVQGSRLEQPQSKMLF